MKSFRTGLLATSALGFHTPLDGGKGHPVLTSQTSLGEGPLTVQPFSPNPPALSPYLNQQFFPAISPSPSLSLSQDWGGEGRGQSYLSPLLPLSSNCHKPALG